MKRSGKQNGFTLIELMVVIVVISLLAAAVFRMVAAVGKGNDKAATRATLEKVSHALEEFKAQYGKYPPVRSYPGEGQPMRYEYPNASSKGWGSNPETTAQIFLDADKAKALSWNQNKFYTFGLVSFFLPRYNGTASRGPKRLAGVGVNDAGEVGQTGDNALSQWKENNRKLSSKIGDSAKDLNACRKILPYLDGGIDEAGNIDYGIIDPWFFAGARTFTCDFKTIHVTNHCATIKDAWDRQLKYVSRPPYESYKLYSAGPDGAFDTADDIVAGQD